MITFVRRYPWLALLIFLAGCGGGGGGPGGAGGGGAGDSGCTGSCANAASFLTVAEVQQIIAQAVNEAQARGALATIAVVDRVGNVLGVFRMTGAAPAVTITSLRGVTGGLEGVNIIPDTAAAIAKAVTAAYLSSEGNAFTTRTANQIVQEHFNPLEFGQPSGPLFGVQFSQLPCSDFSNRFPAAGTAGPKRSPLGLSADPGGLPLYKAGTPVGGVGVISDAIYGLDLNITDIDTVNDELIAVAGTSGFAAPTDRRADRITADGRTFRFTDSEAIASNPAAAPGFAVINGVLGTLLAVNGYSAAAIIAGTAFGQPASGIRPDASGAFAGLNAYVVVDAANANRFPPTAGVVGGLTAAEVTQILASALTVANRARAQIRRPVGTPARVTISVVDTNGVVLGLVRTLDAPVFGTDVALQKARSAAFFSNAAAAANLAAAPPAVYQVGPPANSSIAAYVPAAQAFGAGAFTGGIAYSNRAVGNIARPYYPDGIPATANGPFSKPFANWSPFSDGLQLDLVINRVVGHVGFLLGGADVAQDCTTVPGLLNGIQIFPGSVPIYRGGVLVGAVGVSGDGVDQDDMVAFLGLNNAGQILGTGIGNAPLGIRADTLAPQGVLLRYVQCPQSPFIDSTQQNVCSGL